MPGCVYNHTLIWFDLPVNCVQLCGPELVDLSVVSRVSQWVWGFTRSLADKSLDIVISLFINRETVFENTHVICYQHRRTKPGLFLYALDACFMSDISMVPMQDIFVQCRHDAIHSAVVFRGVKFVCDIDYLLWLPHTYTHTDTRYCCVPLSFLCAFHSQATQRHSDAEQLFPVVTASQGSHTQ